MRVKLEYGEFDPYREAASIRLFNPNSPQDRKAIKRLDMTSRFAYNPFAMGEDNPRRQMTAEELNRFISKGDKNHHVRAITTHGDRRAIGFAYFSRTDSDDVVRLPYVHAMAEGAGMVVTHKTKVFDFNFDLPERSDYAELGMSAVKQGLEEFFHNTPDAAVVFYFEHADLEGDPDDYNIMVSLGATDIGNINYENPENVPTDHVLYLDKSHFDHRVNQNDRIPHDYTKTSLPTLHALEQRANEQIV